MTGLGERAALTRRSALAAALAALPGLALAASDRRRSVPEKDPIFAAIEEHAALESRASRGATEDEIAERCAEADEKLHALVRMRPKSLASACALLLHVAGQTCEEFDDEDALPHAVRSVSAAFAATPYGNSAKIISSAAELTAAIGHHKEALAAFEDGREHSDEETAQLSHATFRALRRLVAVPCASDGDFFAKASYLLEQQIAALAGFDERMLKLEEDFGPVVIALGRHLRERAPRAAAAMA